MFIVRLWILIFPLIPLLSFLLSPLTLGFLRIVCKCLFFDKKKNRKSAIKWSSLQFYGMITLVKSKPLCRGTAWLPFLKEMPKFIFSVSEK